MISAAKAWQSFILQVRSHHRGRLWPSCPGRGTKRKPGEAVLCRRCRRRWVHTALHKLHLTSRTVRYKCEASLLFFLFTFLCFLKMQGKSVIRYSWSASRREKRSANAVYVGHSLADWISHVSSCELVAFRATQSRESAPSLFHEDGALLKAALINCPAQQQQHSNTNMHFCPVMRKCC